MPAAPVAILGGRMTLACRLRRAWPFTLRSQKPTSIYSCPCSLLERVAWRGVSTPSRALRRLPMGLQRHPQGNAGRSGYMALVTNTRTGMAQTAFPADWGPNDATDRVADLSPALMRDLDLETDDDVEVAYPWGTED